MCTAREADDKHTRVSGIPSEDVNGKKVKIEVDAADYNMRLDTDEVDGAYN